MSDPFLNTVEAAAYVRCAPNTLEKMRLRGDGPPFRKLSPKRIIYVRDELDAWTRNRPQFKSTSEYEAA